jgi:hypothetical protein
MIEIVMPACSMPQSVPPMLVSWRALARMSGSVKTFSLFIMTRAPRNSFHEVMKANSETVTIAGRSAGMRIRRSSCQLEQPLIT